MNNDPLVRIKSIKKISKHIGRDISKELLIPIEEMKDYIKPREVCSIVKQYAVTKNNGYYINTTILQKIFSEVKNWVLGVQLAKMASDGQLESMWDNEQNCMVFKSI